MTLEEVKIRLAIENSAIARGLTETRQQIRTWAGGIGKTIGSAFGDAFKGIAASFGIHALMSQMSDMISRARQIQSEAKALGVSTGTLQALPLVAKKIGQDPEEAALSLRKLNENLGDAQQGGEFAAKFKQWGIAIRDSNGELSDTETVLKLVMEKMKSLTTGTERAAMAHDLLGKAGKGMVATLMQGYAALEKAKLNPKILSEQQLGALSDMKMSANWLGQALLAPILGIRMGARLLGGASGSGGNEAFALAAYHDQTLKLQQKAMGAKGVTPLTEAELKNLDEISKLTAESAKLKRESEFEGMSNEEKLTTLKKERLMLDWEMYRRGVDAVSRARVTSEIDKKDLEIAKQKKQVWEDTLKASEEWQRKQDKIVEHEAKLTRDIKENRDDIKKSLADSKHTELESFKPTLEQVAGSGWWNHRKGGRKWTWMQTDDSRNANLFLDQKQMAEDAYLGGNKIEGDRLAALALKTRQRLSPAVRQDSYLADIAKATRDADDRLVKILAEATRTADNLEEE